MKRPGTIAACCVLAASSWPCAAAVSPLSPEHERSTFRLADPNLTIELVAAEPAVRAPVALAWDADGRMFVAEMTDYPSGPVNGRIRLLEDRDGDGSFERATVFATNLAFPNGVMAWKNGVLVTAAPDIWFLADTNSDGVADVREKILTGFAEGNQQLRVNGLFWGLDNWIYGANGRSDGEVKWADGTPAGSIRRHDFRFRPETKQFEAIAGNSQFGMGHDDWGNRFPVFNATPIRHVVIEDRYLARQPLLAGTDNVPSISPADDGNRVFPLTSPNVLIPQPVGFFTSACGPSIFRGTALPESYRGNYFVCEPVQNLVQRRVLRPRGSTFVAEYADASGSPLPSTGRGDKGEGWKRDRASQNANTSPPNHPSPSIPLPVEGRGKNASAVQNDLQPAREFLASSDPWFHGVFTATGPDGALYIVDFYRDLVEHPHWVAPELRDKIDWRKGEEHGRIWRVRAKEAKLAEVERLSHASDAQLVKALESRNGWTRDTAHRLLVEREAVETISALRVLVHNEQASDAARLHALYVAKALPRFKEDLFLAAIDSKSPRLREHGVRIIEPDYDRLVRHFTMQRYHALTDDDDARVRLQVACSLGQWLSITNANLIQPLAIDGLKLLARHPALDDWQVKAILSSCGSKPWWLLVELTNVVQFPTEAQTALLEGLCYMTAASTNAVQHSFLHWLKEANSASEMRLLAAFLRGLESPSLLKRTVSTPAAQPFVASALELIRDKAAVVSSRLAAVFVLAKTAGSASGTSLEALLKPDEPDAILIAAAKALIELDDPVICKALLQRCNTYPTSARRQLIASAANRPNLASLLLDAVAAEQISILQLHPATREALGKFADPAIRERAAKLFASAVSPDRDAVVRKYHASLKLFGDRKHGAEIFERTCSVCHQMQGAGAKVGPDLSGTGQQPRETLLVQILDPSRQVLPDFISYTATMRSGDTYTGFIANESATTVTLRRANEPDITLRRAELNEITTSGKSLMPDGLEAGMTEQDMADLLEFLRRPDRTLFTQSK